MNGREWDGETVGRVYVGFVGCAFTHTAERGSEKRGRERDD